jgi:hypothetical protein
MEDVECGIERFLRCSLLFATAKDLALDEDRASAFQRHRDSIVLPQRVIC